MHEERLFERQQTGKLKVIAGGSVQCTLLDISRGGARLSSRRRLPDQFYLMLRPDLKRWCNVAWRKGDEVGVKFIPDPTAGRS